MSDSIGNARTLTAQWYYKELWGWDLEEVCTGPVRGTFLKALLTCANGDGALAPAERKWVIGRAAAGGAPDELLAELQSYSANEDITEIVGRTLTTDKSRRAVVYFAIRAASSDEAYSSGEKQSIRKTAAAMGIDESVVEEIEALVIEEERLKAKRIRLCFPDGDPFGR